MSNDKLAPAQILEPHIDQTWQRVKDHSLVLAIQDSTQVDYSYHNATEGLGVLQNKRKKGFWCHSTLAITPDRLPLGLLHQSIWARDPEEFGKRHKRKNRPIAEKESNKWLEALRATAALQARAPETEVLHVADREADIIDFFQLAVELGVSILVRGNWNRRTTIGKVWDVLKSQSVAGTMVVDVPERKGVPARQAKLELRHCAQEILMPGYRKAEHAAPVKVNCVLAVEVGAEEAAESDEAEKSLEETLGLGSPIQWLLYTTRPVQNLDDARQLVKLYSCRWTIEMWHRVLKSGCNIEDHRLQEGGRLQRCMAVDSVVAYRLLYLTMAARVNPDSDCSHLFKEHEWQALYVFFFGPDNIPEEPPTAEQALLWVAKLGGYQGPRKNKSPGTQTIWNGLQRLSDLAHMWALMSKMTPLKNCG